MSEKQMVLPYEPQTERGPEPSVGRIVHYVAFGTPGGEYKAGACRAAIITEMGIQVDNVGLTIFNPTGIHFRAEVPFDPTKKTPGTWHWPERK